MSGVGLGAVVVAAALSDGFGVWCSYVMPNHVLIAICTAMPLDSVQLLECCRPGTACDRPRCLAFPLCCAELTAVVFHVIDQCLHWSRLTCTN